MSAAGIPKVSVIVPVWGDERLVIHLLDAANLHQEQVEWIIASVHPTGAFLSIAEQNGIRVVACAEPSRGAQMNKGAEAARGRLLCFHHADTEMTSRHLDALLSIADDPAVTGGAFHRQFDNRHRWMRRWEKTVQTVNGRFLPLFGDQSIFINAEAFQKMGGFAEIPLMEDLEFSGRLRAAGKIRLLYPAISSSPRRFQRMGNWRTSAFNALLITLFYAGVSPHRLHQWYYRHRAPSKRSGGGARNKTSGSALQ